MSGPPRSQLRLRHWRLKSQASLREIALYSILPCPWSGKGRKWLRATVKRTNGHATALRGPRMSRNGARTGRNREKVESAY